MADNKLLNSLSKLGFQMFEPSEEMAVNETLAEVVKSPDVRLREGFPVLLVNAAENYQFSLEQVAELLTPEEQRQLHRLLLLSAAVYMSLHLSFPWLNRLKKDFSTEDKDRVKALRNALAHNREEMEGFDLQRVMVTFSRYFEQKVAKDKRRKDTFDEFSVEYALSQLFSPKQKELFKKKLENEPFTKTEQEYYSRTVKRKVVALANSDLHSLARKLLEM